MNGQWLGEAREQGQHTADLILNLDKVGDFYQGLCFQWPKAEPAICTTVFVKIPKDENPFRVETEVMAFTGNPNVPFPFVDRSKLLTEIAGKPQSVGRRAYIEGDWLNNRMRASVTTDLGESVDAILYRMDKKQESSIEGTEIPWRDLKSLFFDKKYRKFIYRGQSNSKWPLRSLFHRCGRADLFRYTTQDVPSMFQRLSGSLSQFMNIGDNDNRGAFIHLLQHHGYPTPLLDWSYSPFVASFFAFRKYSHETPGNSGHVRVFQFDVDAWREKVELIAFLATPRRNLSFMEFQTQNNPRTVPQQALSSVTSVDDVERYIKSRELGFKHEFIRAYDIPISDAPQALSDLRKMGVTAGSLFPGVDGACEEMRALRFQPG